MLIKVKYSIYLISIILLLHLVNATTYYIDFENGNDSNTGIYPETPWKHAPGDQNAVNIPKNIVLKSGDKLLFKGNTTYIGSITLREDSINITNNRPIIISGNDWGVGKSILEGGTLLNKGWKKCESKEECGNNTHWENIYYIYLNDSYSIDSGVFDDTGILSYSQEPNPKDPFIYDKVSEFISIPLNDSILKMNRTSITDPRYFFQNDTNYWNNSYVLVWRVPNVVVIKKILHFNPDNHTIHIEDVGGDLYEDRDNRYAIINNINLIDTPGEYYLDINNDTLYLWPRSNINKTVISKEESTAIYVTRGKNIVFKGFNIRHYSRGIRFVYDGTENITIYNNTLEDLKSSDNYAIEIWGKNINISNNVVYNGQRSIGIFNLYAENVSIYYNNITKASRQGILQMYTNNSIIKSNKIMSCKGNHANGISIYDGCDNVTIMSNKVDDSNIALTMSDSKNINIYNNIFIGNENSNYVVAAWSRIYGVVNIFNNIIYNSTSNTSIYISNCDVSNIFLINNILDGGGCGIRNNNIYTSLSWYQDEDLGWSLNNSEIYFPNITKLFEDPYNKNFYPLFDSPSIDSGLDMSDYYSVDINNTIRPQGNSWDIGAYEYVYETQNISCYNQIDINCDNQISLDELNKSIYMWKNNIYNISYVMHIISIWKYQKI